MSFKNQVLDIDKLVVSNVETIKFNELLIKATTPTLHELLDFYQYITLRRSREEKLV